MRKTLLFFLMAVSFLTFAEGNEKSDQKSNSTVPLKILVIDAETGDPIPAAKVNIEKIEKENYTDFEGIAQFDDLNQGVYEIHISFISYQKVQLKEYFLNTSSSNLLVRLQP